ncbi:hypothetical protein FAS41_27865 [Pseudomonas nicosulfuronedens]|uniref:Uncharacterized protein n=1 Tax=Pseudomonas nicosulfuronedens TaxID=2571105 RepID=A0A5R9QMF7_9PSED|nr:helix-turn-helix domain-containing protein [Pseudomonas nicosulfuronedens]TLX70485.1 hypothetical protein FAS41_27865 [Pseudomonas nicosulfuronedens]
MTNLERLHSQAKSAGAPVDMNTPSRPAFDRTAATLTLIRQNPNVRGADLTRQVDQMEAEYHRSGVVPKNPQAVVRRHHGKVKALHRELSQELRAVGYHGRYASASEVQALLTEAHDKALEESRPSARAILREQVGEQDAARLATTKSRHMKAAMQKLANHPTAQLLEAQGMRTARDVSEICKATLAGGVQALYQRADVAKRLSAQEKRMAELSALQDAQARELEELRRQLAQAQAKTEARLSAVENATDWKAAAVRLKAEGLNAGEIARRLGQKHETVRKHLQRNT